MADIVETPFNIPFQNPRCRCFPVQIVENLFDCISTTSVGTKAVAVTIRSRFRDRLQSEQVECLHSSVFHRGDAQRAEFAIGFGNVYSLQRTRFIAVSPQVVDSIPFLCRRAPGFSVDSRGFTPGVLSNPSDSQRFGCKRAGQQTLQSFDSAPLLLLSCVAFTIRVWSRLTVRYCRFQLMVCQLPRCGAADTLISVFILPASCFRLLSGVSCD